ncbi:hypothetical protein BpHYR1_018058 [Brachionus plicatilis]|uniref:Uncharacterized protein n=1 Tax=Brachionus plicatilis TaxID=10195 RepID=A0A3M7S494_BRAPC|nr:hypothetical protein BpHYR1_018058 [Brachionus plicatilis]
MKLRSRNKNGSLLVICRNKSCDSSRSVQQSDNTYFLKKTEHIKTSESIYLGISSSFFDELKLNMVT